MWIHVSSPIPLISLPDGQLRCGHYSHQGHYPGAAHIPYGFLSPGNMAFKENGAIKLFLSPD